MADNKTFEVRMGNAVYIIPETRRNDVQMTLNEWPTAISADPKNMTLVHLGSSVYAPRSCQALARYLEAAALETCGEY